MDFKVNSTKAYNPLSFKKTFESQKNFHICSSSLKFTIFFSFNLFLGVVFAMQRSHAQSIYKTPYGKKYHLATCRMVENVSRKISSLEEIHEMGLEPCKICKPPPPSFLNFKSLNGSNKAKGVAKTTQCKGITKKGTRCQHMTTIANGYCYQHTEQAPKRPPE